VSADATVVWLASGEARDDAARALREWARARGVILAPPPSAEASAPFVHDPALAAAADKELERAHDALSANDADAAERSLARVEALLRDHPELPEAPWLRAEVERTWSARWLRLQPRDEARARAAWENAAALDGGRVAGVGETSFPPRAARVKATIVLEGPAATAPGATLYFDGVRLEPARRDADEGRGRATVSVEVAPAEHHVLASLGGRVVFATWLAIVGPDPTPARIALPASDACARDLFRGVRRDEGRILAPGIACPAWVAAVPGERRGSVFVARCERDQCGPLLEWRTEGFAAAGPPQAESHAAGWPRWATWAIVGAGAVAAASIALVATGAFETRVTEPRFVVGGVRQE
jgi:hypothetical protein